MDTTEQYIKMCEGAIADLWADDCNWRIGSLWFNKKTGVIIPIAWTGPWSKHEVKRYVPLWQQDQLQEMLRGERKHSLETWNLHWAFHNWLIRSGVNTENGSFEQLWLVFVMHEKYGKRWDGEKWVKEK